MENDLKQLLLAELLKESQTPVEKKIETPQSTTCSELLKLYDLLNEKYEFKVGDFVEWKSAGLKDRSFPAIREPAIVMAVLEKPLTDTAQDVGSPAFNQKYDLILGVSVKGVLMSFHYNSTRFKPFVN